jgi:8-oxo-dGTP pyrophosphatase MutT (NUDIX family)
MVPDAMTLLREIEWYAPADALESRHHAAMRAMLAESGAPFSRAQFAPGHVTAGCFIVDEGRGALLLHHHRRLGRWLQMGGHVESGETPRAAALREGKEESGLDDLELVAEAIFDLDVHAIPAGRGEPDHRHFDVRYLVRSAHPEWIAIDPAESNDLAWVPLDRAEALMNEEASSRAIRKIRRLV